MRLGKLMVLYLARLGISQREFCRRVGFNPGNFNQIMRGRRPPPLACLPRWRKALKLAPEEQATLEEAWLLALSPPAIQALVETLRRDCAALTLERDRLRDAGPIRTEGATRYRAAEPLVDPG